jgi:hypothetical protein
MKEDGAKRRLMMKITKLVVGKGLTRELEGRWSKEYFEITCELEFKEEPETAKNKAVTMIEGWLTGKPATPASPRSSTGSFDDLPWKKYRSKENCEPGEAGWTFRYVYDTNRTVPGAEVLVSQLDPEGKKWIRIGDMQYRLSGHGLSLIQRRPVNMNGVG